MKNPENHRVTNQPLFVDGPITKSQLGQFMHDGVPDAKTGATAVFQGWVRADEINGKTVAAINFTAYPEMGEQQLARIKQELAKRYAVSKMLVVHSLGRVRVGDCCFFVQVSAPRRRAAFDACRLLVDRVKAELAIWGEELLEDGSVHWKINTAV